MGISDDIKPRRIYRYENKKDNLVSSNSVNSDKKIEHTLSNLKNEQADDRYSDDTEHKIQIEDDFFNNKTETPKKQTKHHRFPFKLISWLLVIIIVALSIYNNLDRIKNILKDSAYYSPPAEEDDTYLNSDTTGSTSPSTQSENVTTTPVAETVSPTIDKTAIKIEVLNGNGTVGSADKVATTLRTNGFTVSKVANARKFTYLKTYIYYRTGAESYMELVKTFLTDRVCLSEKSDSITSGYDLVIVVGKQ